MEEQQQSSTDLKELLEENLKLTRETHRAVKKIRRYMALRAVMSFVYLLLIVGPLIWAAIYLPPIIGPYWEQYQQLIQAASEINANLEHIPAVTNGVNPTDLFNIFKSLPTPPTGVQ